MPNMNILSLIQLAMVGALLGALAVAPPARGAMMLVPVAGSVDGAMLRAVVDAGGRLVGRSGRGLMVDGRRGPMAQLAIAHSAILIAAPDGLCGGRGR